jgi:uncharacterized protein YggE
MKKVLFALALLTSAHVFAQSTISVTGSATRFVDSDEMIIRTGIYEEGEDLDELYKSVQERMSSIIEKFGKDTSFCEIQTELIRIVPDRRYKQKKDEIKRTYMVQQDISFRLRDMTQYDDVVLELMKLGVNQLSDVQFVSSKAEDLKEDVRTDALLAAREKAEKMAETLGMKVLGPVEIIETGAPYVGYNANTIRYDAITVRENGPSIAPAKASVSAKVKVVFKIIPKA